MFSGQSVDRGPAIEGAQGHGGICDWLAKCVFHTSSENRRWEHSLVGRCGPGLQHHQQRQR